MAWLGPEGVIDPALDYIAEKQEERLTEVAGRAWRYPLPMPPFAVLKLADPGREVESQFPVLYAVPLQDEPVEGVGGSLVAAKFRVLWVVLASSAATEDLTSASAAKRLALRYISAVRQMLKDMHNHDEGRPYHWSLGIPRYGDSYTRASGEWLADAQLEATIEHRG